jgi:ATP-dependent RNA helicase DeaD
MKFDDFNFKKELARAINDAGFKEPSPIQKDAIPHILSGNDMIGQAHTGTGKTAAFGLPIIELMECGIGVEAVVVVPTRELAMQVSDELYRFGRFLGIKTATVYGGSSYSRQIKHIENASIIVATPGRLLDLLSKGSINIAPKFVVLDEADEMLDMGFLEDIKEIFNYMPTNRQTLMFSATMPKEIKNLAQSILHNPKIVTVTKSDITNKNIAQQYYVVDERERDEALIRLFDYKNPAKSIVFCRTRKEVDRLTTHLISQGYSAKGLHGDIMQRQREEIIRSFRGGSLEVLIATDVAARGLDVNDVTHVFNYHLPFDSESYVHRIGRTGRAGKDGKAISIVTPSEFNSLSKIQKNVGSTIEMKIIPTLDDVANKNIKDIEKEILALDINSNAYTLLDDLKNSGIDSDTIALRVISSLIKAQNISGAFSIGKTEEEIANLLKYSNRESSGGNSRSRNRRGRYNNSRRGSSRGGSRDNYSRRSRSSSSRDRRR